MSIMTHKKDDRLIWVKMVSLFGNLVFSREDFACFACLSSLNVSKEDFAYGVT